MDKTNFRKSRDFWNLHHLLYIVILCLWKPAIGLSQDACDICNCTLDNFRQWRVDCSNRNLSSSMVPAVYPNLTISLNLSHNSIGALLNRSFSQLHNLKILDVSNTSLNQVEQEAFDGLYKLEVLNISHNYLQISNITVPVRYVRDLKSLKVLKMNHNIKDTRQTNISFPDEALGQVKSLQTLFLDGLTNSTFGPGFQNLLNLTNVIFSGEKDVGYCGLKSISVQTFKNVFYIESLIIRECGIEHIDEHAFSTLPYLSLLDLSGNKKLGIEGAARCFQGLKNTSIKVLKLNNIYPDFSIGVRIKKEHMEMLRNTSITELEFSGNKVEIVDGETFDVMPIHLTKLNVSFNRFLMGDYLLHASSLKNLTTCDASYQFFSLLNAASFNKRDLNSHQDTTSLTMIKWTNLTIQVPENLKVANFSHSKLAFPVLRFRVGRNRVEYLDASYSMLYNWTGPVLGFDSLTYLDLSNNHCSELSFQFFDYLPRLVTLLVSNNLLGIVISREKDGRIFQNLKSLQHLDLSNNRITSMNENIFQQLVNIEILNISHNLLDTFLVKIGHMNNLRVLDLSQNMLQVVQDSVGRTLEDVASMRTDNVYVNISHNQLRCMCSTLQFMIWVRDTKTIVVGMTSCMIANGTKAVFKYKNDLIRYMNYMDKECMSNLGLIFGTTICISLAIVTAVVDIVYRYRWKFRYLYYMTMNKFKGYHPIGNFDTDNSFVYDAFIACADEDCKFVQDLLLNELEHKRGMRLFVPCRDIKPGNKYLSSVVEAIHNSRKTVMLLTENFLLSKWCLYEFQMAYQKAIDSGQDTVIVILYEHIPHERINRVKMMRDFFKSNSYIEHPHMSRLDVNEQVLNMFWDKCTQAIKESGNFKKLKKLQGFHISVDASK